MATDKTQADDACELSPRMCDVIAPSRTPRTIPTCNQDGLSAKLISYLSVGLVVFGLSVVLAFISYKRALREQALSLWKSAGVGLFEAITGIVGILVATCYSRRKEIALLVTSVMATVASAMLFTDGVVLIKDSSLPCSSGTYYVQQTCKADYCLGVVFTVLSVLLAADGATVFALCCRAVCCTRNTTNMASVPYSIIYVSGTTQ